MKKWVFVLMMVVLSIFASACSMPAEEEREKDSKLEMEKAKTAGREVKESGKEWMEGLPEKKIIDAPHIKQLPELARGCEVTSLAMLLQYGGIQVDKMTLAKEVEKNQTPYRNINGEIYFGDPREGFVGNIYTFDEKGYAVFHEPIFELGERYLPNGLRDLSGGSFSEVYQALGEGKPVWVITTSTFDIVQPDEWEKWNTPNGEIYITMKEHAVLITGYDDQYLYINNPLGNKNEKLKKEPFIAGWEQLGHQAITLK